MSVSTVNSDVYVNGNLAAKTMTIPNASIGDAQIAAGAAVQSSKLEMRWQKEYAQPGGSAATGERKVIHATLGASGAILQFVAGARIVPTGNAYVTVDLQKNGATILSAPVNINSSDTNYTLINGTLTNTTLATNDVLEAVVVTNVGSGVLPNGVFAEVRVTELF